MMAKYLATSLAIEKVVSDPLVISSCLPMATISMSLVGLESRSTMLPASLAATVPVFMATPTSAWARAGASLVPSPVMATSLPSPCSARISSILRSGVAWARKSSTPASLAMAAAVSGVAPVIVAVRRSWSKRSRMPPLTTSLRWTTPRGRAPSATTSGVPPSRAMSSTIGSSSPGTAPAWLLDPGNDGVGGPLADLPAVEVRPRHPGLGGEGDEPGALLQQLPAAQAVALLGQDHDRAALGGLVGQRGELGGVDQLGHVHPGQGEQLGGLTGAEGDGGGVRA